MEKAEESSPEYIEYLLSPHAPMDFHIIVFDPLTGVSERIGVDKLMLIARSPTMRKMMLESPLKHDKEMVIEDVEPEIFKYFLKFMYGLDLVSSHSVEESLKLLYVAEKYEVVDLKDKISSALQPKVSMDNVFMFLEYAAVCETTPQLWAAVVKILQMNTRQVFSQPRFVEESLTSVLRILEQECMNVREVEVWKAALAWATHQVAAAADDSVHFPTPERVREKMLPLLKHIRLCTMSGDELTTEVIPTKILTYDEVCQVCLSIDQQRNCISSDLINNKIEKRMTSFHSDIKECNLHQGGNWAYGGNDAISELYFLTKKSSIKLITFVITGLNCPWTFGPTGSTYEVKGTIKMYKITDYIKGTVPEPPFCTIEVAKQTEYGRDVEISLEDEDISLSPNNMYKIIFNFANTAIFYKNDDSNIISNDEDVHIKVVSTNGPMNRYQFWYCHLKTFNYQTDGCI